MPARNQVEEKQTFGGSPARSTLAPCRGPDICVSLSPAPDPSLSLSLSLPPSLSLSLSLDPSIHPSIRPSLSLSPSLSLTRTHTTLSFLSLPGCVYGRACVLRQQVGQVIKNYKLGEVLGKGSNGTVYKTLNMDTGDVVAIKQVPADLISCVCACGHGSDCIPHRCPFPLQRRMARPLCLYE